MITKERKSNRAVLVLDAGNSLTGDRDPALKSAGASSIEAMDLLGYDAMALGPADLKLGPATLRARMAEATFPVLSANAIDRETGERLAKPYVVREFDGHRVVIIGLSASEGTDRIIVRDPLSTLQDVLAELKGDLVEHGTQADEIILLSTAEASTNRQIADNVAEITAIVEGGSGASAKPWVSSRTGTPIFHADEASPGHAGRILGIAVLTLGGDGNLTNYTWQRFSLGPEVAEDAAMAAWVRTQEGK
jgi:2',3'-cyclic-nucleotide 2'-phosphodiesterase (5'-nucleotidase family)